MFSLPYSTYNSSMKHTLPFCFVLILLASWLASREVKFVNSGETVLVSHSLGRGEQDLRGIEERRRARLWTGYSVTHKNEGSYIRRRNWTKLNQESSKQ